MRYKDIKVYDLISHLYSLIIAILLHILYYMSFIETHIEQAFALDKTIPDHNEKFEHLAVELFRYQASNNPVYKSFINHLGINPNQIATIQDIPFLPVEFFKSHKVITGNSNPSVIFHSSGTTSANTSKHYIIDEEVYHKSCIRSFEYFYGDLEEFIILGLLPSYLEQQNSSLIHMVRKFMEKSNNPQCDFFLDDHESLLDTLTTTLSNKKKLLIGVSYALLDLVEKHDTQLRDLQDKDSLIVMETGGMKGRRNEITRNELHSVLKSGFGIDQVHSEYGMTEILSQAYSQENGIYNCPPWMKILTRDLNDPQILLEDNATGGINIIDLANVYSCSFIASQDLGKCHKNGNFEVLGRFDTSDVRGCNLMV